MDAPGTLEQYIHAVRALPLHYKVVGLVFPIVLIVALCSGVGGLVSRYKDRAFDRAEAARAEERAVLAAERDAWIKRAEAAEAQAAVLEEQAAVLKKVANDAGETAKQKAAKVEEIEHATRIAIDAAGDLSPNDARALARAKLRQLGFLR